ncbi:MAG: DUF3368 domain-containing protein [Armatimonadota bacterium]|nr:DUF3368 domain-containing protein [Armatimonadota bacterium]
MSVSPAWIVNASPFIGLAKIGRLNLLTRSAPSASDRAVFLPDAVAREIAAGTAEDAAVRALSNLGDQGITVLPPVTPDPRLAAFTLDAGETAVLTEALARPGCVAVIDDGPGRAAAQVLGVSLVGSVGVLILARRQGGLTALAPEIRALQSVGLFLPREGVLRALLAEIGETWP